MYELSVACKYLTPRWRQLSVSIISLVSILVIALVVWLIVVFFSVTHGLEKNWIYKLTALTAPVRVTPTEAYYQSYYYQIDGISASSDYTLKSIHEKLNSQLIDPYDPSVDEEIPSTWAKPLIDEKGRSKDIVKETYRLAANLPNVKNLIVSDFEMTSGNLRLHMVRESKEGLQSQSLSQTTYLGTFDPTNPALSQVILPLTDADKKNLAREIAIAGGSIKNDGLTVSTIENSNGKQLVLPSDTILGEGILAPKSYQNAGALIGDRGHLTYYAATTSSMQEQHLPVYIAGFYDPGIFPIGSKFILANPELISLVHSSQQQSQVPFSSGFNIRFSDFNQAAEVKANLEKALQENGLAPYWHIETYREFDFTKDLIQQLSSERNLWTLLATVIIIVACSNIISMLIILVNDKKLEIGILRSMGASSASIAIIFGACGMVMGAAGSIIGTLAAVLTLRNLQALVNFIGRVQGYDMFNPVFYGNTLPNEFSFEALLFVVIMTSGISLLAGIVPAIKASMIRPSNILRAE